MNKNKIRLTEIQLHNLIKESVKMVLKETYTESKPFSSIEGVRHVTYGDLSQLLLVLKRGDYVHGGVDSFGTDGTRCIFDLSGKYNEEAWSMGRTMPECTCGVCIDIKKGATWKTATPEDIDSVKAVLYDHYRGCYSYWNKGRELKNTTEIPIRID